MLSIPDSIKVQNLIISAALEELIPRFNDVDLSFKKDGSIITEADLAVHSRLEQELHNEWPEIAFLSEELPEQQRNSLIEDHDTPFWCLDPLDGTSNFAAGIPAFVVSISLIVQGKPVIGITYDPIRDESFCAEKGKGAWLNERPLRLLPIDRPIKHALAVVDFKRLSSGLTTRLINNPPYGSQRNFGTCALEWAWMAAGRGHLYLHGGQQIWDYAAGNLILAEAGGHSCTLEQDTVFKCTPNPRSVIASPDAQLFDQFCAWIHDKS